MSDTNYKHPKIPTVHVELADIAKSKPKAVIKQDKAFYATIARKTRPYKSLPNKFKPALYAVADYVMKEMIPRTFQKEGPGWAPLSRRTQAEREMAGYSAHHPILRRTGDLLKELTDKSHPKHIEVIRVGKNSRIEIGGSSKKFVENQMGVKEQHLPSRPMIPGTGNIRVETRDRQRIAMIIRRTINKELSRK